MTISAYISENDSPDLQGIKELVQEFNDNLKRFFEKRFNLPYFDCGEATKLLRDVGFSEGKVILRRNTLDRKVSKHDLLYSDLIDLPKLIRKPLLVIESKAVDGALVLILDRIVNDNLLLVSIKPDKRFERMNVYEVNDITSVYDKKVSGITSWLKDGGLLYADEKKLRACLTRLQLPTDPQTLIELVTNILQKETQVNTPGKKSQKNISGLGTIKVLNSNQYGPEAYEPSYQTADYGKLISLGSISMITKGTGDIEKVLAAIREVIGKYSWQVKQLAQHLKADTVEQSAFNVWHFMRRIEVGGNINYKLDSKGKEELRTPARTWRDRVQGVDCDDMAIFSACLLLNMGYAPKLHVVAFNGREKPGHIYTVVDGIVVDGVMKRFDKHPDGITKTRIMALEINVLDGLPDNTLLGIEANPISSYTQELMDEQSELIAEAKQTGLTPELRRELRKIRVLINMNGMDEQEVLGDVMPLVRDVQNGELLFDDMYLKGLAGDYLGNRADIETANFAGLGMVEPIWWMLPVNSITMNWRLTSITIALVS